MKKIAILMVGLMLSGYASAIGGIIATIVAVRVESSGQGMVIFNQSIGGNPPSCVIPAYKNALAFDANTTGGKAILAMALAAKASGSQVTAYGLGTCSLYGVVEDWNYGVTQ